MKPIEKTCSPAQTDKKYRDTGDILRATYPDVSTFLKNHPDTPILFLDIDGVLNSEEFYVERAKNSRSYTSLDPVAVKRLNALEGAAVVISSSWGFNDNTVRELADAGLDLPVIAGVTPYWYPYGDRGAHIKKWCETFLTDGRKFAIVDDDSDMEDDQLDVFVQTSPYTGLTDRDVESLRRILGLKKY